jgi:DNA primase
VPEGVYRELLLDRLAQEVRMPAPRLAELLKLEDADDRSPQQSLARARRPDGEGRRPLLTQAIKLVLHHPGAAHAVVDPATLRRVELRGIEVLVELIEAAAATPGLSTAQLIERWRDRPEWSRLNELAAEPGLMDEQAAGQDLANAIAKLVAEAGPGRRLDELIALSRDRKLTQSEQQELQSLLSSKSPQHR